MKNNKKGFTVIELGIFIVILAVILVVGVNYFIKYMDKSKRITFISSAKLYVSSSKQSAVLNNIVPLDVGDKGLIEISTLKLESQEKESPYGKGWVDDKSFIIVENVGTNNEPQYMYSVALEDTAGNCIELTKEDDLDAKLVKKGTCAIKKPETVSNGIDQIVDSVEEFPDGLKKDEFGNVRYYGASPKNYVQFNNELWQIIGVFKVDGEQRMKIIRNESIGKFSWDNRLIETWSYTVSGSNDWTEARLMKLLNPGYEGESVGGSLYWNKKAGSCYAGTNNATVACDFTTTGLTEESKNMIAKSPFILSGYTSTNISVNNMYREEKGTPANDNPRTWIGYVGLMYPSDYGYAVDEKKCNEFLSNYHQENCKSNNYFQLRNTSEWLLSPNVGPGNKAFSRNQAGLLSSEAEVNEQNDVRPVVYLKSTVKIASGDGSLENPYILK